MGVVGCMLSLVLEFGKRTLFPGGVFPKGKVIECVFYESTKQQKHQTTEGFPRFSIQILSILSSFPSFYSMNPETDLRLMDS